VPLQHRLVIEEFEVRRGADHVQMDDVLGARREVRPAARQRIRGLRAEVTVEQGRERDGADTGAEPLQEGAAGKDR